MPEFCVLGGTGFVGRHLVSALCGQDQRALIKVLSRSRPANPLPGNVSWVKLDVTDINALKAGVGKAEVVYYLPGILAENRDQSYEEVHYEGVMHTLEALAGRSIRRLVHVSAVGAAINAPSAYHRTKKKAEEAIERSGFPYTIVRPSLIFGPGDQSISQFLAFGRKLHVLPMIGPGTAKVQPVFVRDLGKMLALLPSREETAGKIYEVGGPRIYTYREMMEAIRKSAHLKATILSAPVAVMMLSGVAQRLLLPHPFLTPDVIRMALSDNITRKNALITDFKMNLTSLESYLESGIP